MSESPAPPQLAQSERPAPEVIVSQCLARLHLGGRAQCAGLDGQRARVTKGPLHRCWHVGASSAEASSQCLLGLSTVNNVTLRHQPECEPASSVLPEVVVIGRFGRAQDEGDWAELSNSRTEDRAIPALVSACWLKLRCVRGERKSFLCRKHDGQGKEGDRSESECRGRASLGRDSGRLRLASRSGRSYRNLRLRASSQAVLAGRQARRDEPGQEGPDRLV